MMKKSDKTSIIVVDDHQIIIDGIKEMLAGDMNFIVKEEANNGQEALEKIEASKGEFQVLISDINMPLISGIDLCKIVKKQYPHIKVLILSMYSSQVMIKESIDAEADGYILKNAGKDSLLKALHKITNDGTYYSDEILPILLNKIQDEKQKVSEISILTKREIEILQLIVKEYTSEDIANKLFLSKKTVDNHRTNILQKTGSKSTIGLVKFAMKQGID